MKPHAGPPRVLVAHVGGQHATRMVEALGDGGTLLSFVTGICFAHRNDGMCAGRISGIRTIRVAPGFLARSWVLGAFALVPQRLLPARMRKYWNHLLWWMFGARASRAKRLTDADVIVGFENSCLALFRRSLGGNPGAVRVLECPSVHYTAQQYGDLSRIGRWFVARINSVKQAEIALADRIVVLSNFARSTFIQAGVPAAKLHVIPMGVDISFFGFTPMAPPQDHFKFLFVGSTTYSKGIDTLVQAFETLKADRAELRIVGVGTPTLDLLARGNPAIVTLGPMAHDSLREEYRRAHVLVLPSRFDGFALVVTEAMSVGRPAIVTSSVGAADLITTDGANACGWIVPPGDARALAAAMRSAIHAGARLPTMGDAARRAVESHSWDRYAVDVREFYSEVRVAAR